jgi:alpha-1,3-rhamnosyl/mannosyltransferase
VVHCTIYRGPLRSPVPTLVTVHDLAVLRHPEVFTAWTRLYGRTALRATVRAARRVVAVSEFSRQEVAALCGVDLDRIDVVPNAIDPAFSPDGPASPGEYLLAVGTLEPRKNLGRVIEAATKLGAELRVVGARGWGRVAMEGRGVHWLGRLSDEELAEAYRGARCLVYPSLYEGFGIPVAEAMACGTPVVTSRASAMEEVAGGAAVLVDPLDTASIAAGVEEAMGRGRELRAAGLARAAVYTWERAGAAAVAAYERAAG